MQIASSASHPLVPREWMQLWPSTPLLSSDALGWRRIAAYRVKYPGAFQMTLPATGGHFLSAHLNNSCQLSTRWNGTLRTGRSNPGETMIMSANQENSWDGIGEIDELQIFLDPGLLAEAAAEVSDKPVQLVEGIGIRDAVVSVVATRLVEELARPGKCSRLLGDSMAHALTAQLLSNHSNLRAAPAVHRIDMPVHKLRTAIDYIETHLQGDLSIELIAAVVNMSSFRLARGFKKATGRSPHQFIVERRIERAKDLLRSTDRKLVFIARTVGFATPSHFTAVFKQRCNVTPTGYRDQARDDD